MYKIKNLKTAILGFNYVEGTHFLSNFYYANTFRDKFSYKGYNWTCVECAFQAEKCWERADEFVHLRPAKAKRLGKRVPLREDWDEVKDSIMLNLVRLKFQQSRALQIKLLNTENRELVEYNTWGDDYWGMIFNHETQQYEGENKLGIILMKIRDEYLKEEE